MCLIGCFLAIFPCTKNSLQQINSRPQSRRLIWLLDCEGASNKAHQRANLSPLQLLGGTVVFVIAWVNNTLDKGVLQYIYTVRPCFSTINSFRRSDCILLLTWQRWLELCDLRMSFLIDTAAERLAWMWARLQSETCKRDMLAHSGGVRGWTGKDWREVSSSVGEMALVRARRSCARPYTANRHNQL